MAGNKKAIQNNSNGGYNTLVCTVLLMMISSHKENCLLFQSFSVLMSIAIEANGECVNEFQVCIQLEWSKERVSNVVLVLFLCILHTRLYHSIVYFSTHVSIIFFFFFLCTFCLFPSCTGDSYFIKIFLFKKLNLNL